MTRTLALALAALLAFGAFSVYCAVTDGPLGFLTVAFAHRWGMQMFLDVGFSLVVASFWLVPDAKKHGINPWPYVLACVGLGSLSALAYLVHREVKRVRRPSLARV